MISLCRSNIFSVASRPRLFQRSRGHSCKLLSFLPFRYPGDTSAPGDEQWEDGSIQRKRAFPRDRCTSDHSSPQNLTTLRLLYHLRQSRNEHHLMMKPAAAGYRQDRAKEVGSHPASFVAFSVLRSQATSERAATRQDPGSTASIEVTDSLSR
jgi:hypothetical protein